jgi:hypothetical protein
VDAVFVGDVMQNLITLVERGLAEKLAAKDRTKKPPKFLQNLPGVTLKEMRAAVGLLHYLVSLGCNGLMEIAQKKPEILQQIARKQVSWPLMMSRQPGFSVKHIEFLKLLNQGDDAYWDINQTSRAGTQRAPVQKGTIEVAKRLYLCLFVEWKQTQHKLDNKPIAQFCDDEKISSIWWKIARARLLETYPNPCKIPELGRITTAPSKKYPADKNADILRRLKAAFLGLAKNQVELAKLVQDPVV